MLNTCGRFAGTHGGPLSLSSRPFFFLSSVVLFLRSLLSSLLSSRLSLSATMTMISRPVGSLCIHTALTCQGVRVRGLRSIPCLANMFASCKEQLSWYNCASLVPIGMRWACICRGWGEKSPLRWGTRHKHRFFTVGDAAPRTVLVPQGRPALPLALCARPSELRRAEVLQCEPTCRVPTRTAG